MGCQSRSAIVCLIVALGALSWPWGLSGQESEPLYTIKLDGLYRVVPEGEDIKISDEIRPNALLYMRRVFPEYPVGATSDQPTVLDVTIDRYGIVEEIEIVEADPALAAAAVEAVREWEYRPILLDDEPVRIRTRVILDPPGP